jgi:hypothetical protein
MNSYESVPIIENKLTLPISSDGIFCIVSAWHQNKTPDSNRIAHEHLKSCATNLDLTFVELRCTFDFNKNGNVHTSEEKSLFILLPNLNDMLLLGNKNSQVSILYRDQQRFDLMDTNVGRVLSSFTWSEKHSIEDVTAAYTAYIFSRNKDLEQLRNLSLERTNHNSA